MRLGWVCAVLAALISAVSPSSSAFAQASAVYTYDALGRLRTTVTSAGQTTYTYDAADNRTRVQATIGAHLPAASDDSANVSAGASINILVLANDSHPDNYPLTVTAVGPSAQNKGAPALVPGGASVSYRANANATGLDNFTYTVSDDHGGTAQGTVYISFNTSSPPTTDPTNHSPTATPYPMVTYRNSPNAVDPRVRAEDPDGDALTVIGVSQPSHGSASFTATMITYSPIATYSGSDSFSYTVSDGRGGTATAAVNVTVIDNQDPIANSDAITLAYGEVYQRFYPLLNDTDPDGDSLVMCGMTPPSHGTAYRTSQYIDYYPAAEFHGSDSFTYTVCDGHGSNSLSIGAVNVTVAAPPNRDPSAHDMALSTVQAQAGSVTPLIADPDGDPVTITAVSTPSHGTASVVSNAMVTYLPTGNFAGSDTFTYTVSDGRGGTATGTVYVTVAPLPQAPPVAVNDSITLAAGDVYQRFYPLLNDTDPNGDPLVMCGMTSPSHGAAYRTSQYIDYYPTAEFYGSDSFTYTVCDGKGANSFSIGTVNVTVTRPPNQNPSAHDMALNTVRTQAGTVTPLVADPDGDPVTITGVSTPSHGTATVTSATVITYTPTGYYAGSDTFTYNVADNRGGTATGTVYVTVAPGPPLPPVAVDDYISTPHDVAISFDPTVNDSDPDSGFIVVGLITASHGQATRSSRTITYTPNPGYVGPDAIVYNLSDFTALGASATIHITVTP